MASMVDSSPRSIWETLPEVTPMVWASWAWGQAALLALLGEPLAALAGHHSLAVPLSFFGTADAFDVCVAVPLV
jgi:hypothetical protein